ncbi:hypothetical protein [Phreatobacter sp.]|uniref:hypothetical protein n=1 Tax=Phreatobacter sp. TaxID=1966341 RepID=UPI0025E8D997|nr:hypothetical protein [Phreatobacter sp.]
MSRSSSYPPLRSDVTLIELGDDAVGLAVRERSGYRFFAAVQTLSAIDSRLFASLKALRQAAAERHDASRRGRPGAPRSRALAA